MIIIVIHPMWAIDEYASIFRRCVWFSPPHPPNSVDKMLKVISTCILSEGEIWYMIEMGAIFCHVRSIIPDNSGIPCVTSGTQKWKGASPSFIARARVISKEAHWLGEWLMVHWLVKDAL